MISWHKPGQKVVCTSGAWIKPDLRVSRGPATGDVCTITDVETTSFGPSFSLMEWPVQQWGTYLACWFRPIYPAIIDQLRNLDAPVPSDEDVGGDETRRVKEGV